MNTMTRTVNQDLPKMTEHSNELYEEILKFENFSYGKFQDIPYPDMRDREQIKINWNQKSK